MFAKNLPVGALAVSLVFSSSDLPPTRILVGVVLRQAMIKVVI
jgi:hypothetical protein